MKKKLSKTSKREATKKAKTGTTKARKSRTSSKPTMSPTSLLYMHAMLSNLKGTYLTVTDASLSVSGNVTPDFKCEFYLHETTPSGKEVSRDIRIGHNGLEYRGPLEDRYQQIGWSDLLDLLVVMQ